MSPSLIGATSDGPAITGLHSDDAAAAAQPTHNATGLNGRPTLLFDGTDDVLYSSLNLPAPLWHYCPRPTPGEPARVRVAVCGARCDRLDPDGTARGASAAHLVTCPECLKETT